MRWQKIKQVFSPAGQSDWMVSHAANPFVTKLQGPLHRIYFTCRDVNNRSSVGYADIDFEDNFRVMNLSDQPVLSPGEAGLFDDSGVAMACLHEVNGKKFLYYLGWNLKVTVPWLNTIGLAIFDESKNKFVKYSRAPLMDRSDEDPFSISYPFVLHEN